MRQGRKCGTKCGAKWGRNYVLFEKKMTVQRVARCHAVTASLAPLR